MSVSGAGALQGKEELLAVPSPCCHETGGVKGNLGRGSNSGDGAERCDDVPLINGWAAQSKKLSLII